MATHTPLSLAELKKKSKPITNANKQHKESLGRLDKIALWITDHVGTMGFFLIIFTWTALWLSWNIVAPNNMKFDPYPAFVLWLFISNMIQIFLMPLIMIGQNLQGKHSEMRAAADFEVNTKAELEVETILQHLENQNQLMLQILKRLDERSSNNTAM